MTGEEVGRSGDLIRRSVDLTVAVAGLLVLAPVLCAAALLIRVQMGPGVLFRQRRQGQLGREFNLLKFRTMKHPVPGREAPEFDAERITKLGSMLRSTSIDELPSFWNLLKGDITLVGPRPLPVHYWDRYRGDEFRRFEVKPGLTGLAQVSGRNLLDWPERLALDVEYVNTRSLPSDVAIIFRTVPVVLGRSGISSGRAATMHELPSDRP